jgi:hypothetical protein
MLFRKIKAWLSRLFFGESIRGESIHNISQGYHTTYPTDGNRIPKRNKQKHRKPNRRKPQQ